MQRFHAVARRRDHALDLMVFAFEHAQFKRMFTTRIRADSDDRFRFTVQQDAFAQRVELSVVQWMARGGEVDLGHFALGRGECVNKLAIVREQQ